LSIFYCFFYYTWPINCKFSNIVFEFPVPLIYPFGSFLESFYLKELIDKLLVIKYLFIYCIINLNIRGLIIFSKIFILVIKKIISFWLWSIFRLIFQILFFIFLWMSVLSFFFGFIILLFFWRIFYLFKAILRIYWKIFLFCSFFWNRICSILLHFSNLFI